MWKGPSTRWSAPPRSQCVGGCNEGPSVSTVTLLPSCLNLQRFLISGLWEANFKFQVRLHFKAGWSCKSFYLHQVSKFVTIIQPVISNQTSYWMGRGQTTTSKQPGWILKGMLMLHQGWCWASPIMDRKHERLPSVMHVVMTASGEIFGHH
jgi:hypothetical protein